jgi:hypothetical protein
LAGLSSFDLEIMFWGESYDVFQRNTFAKDLQILDAGYWMLVNGQSA